MSLSLVSGGYAEGYNSASGGSIATSGTITVADGDLIVVFASFQDGASTTIEISDGTHTYEHEDVISEPSATYGYAVHAYVLSATAGTYTFTATFGASRQWRAIYAYAFRPDSGDVVSRLDYKSGSGSSTSALTDNLATDGTETDSVMVAGEVQAGMGNQTNELIGEALTRADDSIGYQGGVFYTFSTGSIDGSHAQCTVASGDWAIGVIAFKASPPTLNQEGFRFRNDDGDEASATWLEAQDTDVTAPMDTNTRIRFIVDGTLDPASTQFQLEAKLSTDSVWWKVE